MQSGKVRKFNFCSLVGLGTLRRDHEERVIYCRGPQETARVEGTKGDPKEPQEIARERPDDVKYRKGPRLRFHRRDCKGPQDISVHVHIQPVLY